MSPCLNITGDQRNPWVYFSTSRFPHFFPMFFILCNGNLPGPSPMFRHTQIWYQVNEYHHVTTVSPFIAHEYPQWSPTWRPYSPTSNIPFQNRHPANPAMASRVEQGVQVPQEVLDILWRLLSSWLSHRLGRAPPCGTNISQGLDNWWTANMLNTFLGSPR